MTTNTCAVCQIKANHFCAACKQVRYCGAVHQKQHWKEHKEQCRPFQIANNEILGRHLVATRNIKTDDCIFTEMPLIVGPKWYLTEREEQIPIMPCVGCFMPCRMGAHECSKCRWPVCSTHCDGLENPKNHALECKILALGPGPTSYTDTRALIDYYRMDALVVLRSLLLQVHQPKKWLQLMDMQSHENERLGSELYSEAEQRIVSYLQTNFLQCLKKLEQNSKQQFLREYDSNLLHRICGIVETNYMCINLPTGIELSGIFYTACMTEHACRPNCYFKFDHRKGFKISLIAGRDIQQGENLTIMYSNMLWGTQMRQEHLTLTKHFCCRCERCQDPTEYGTYFSALLCVGDVGASCGGVQLPREPLNLMTDWACNKCPMVISSDEVRYLLTQVTEEVDDIMARKPTVKQLENLIEKLSKFLHPCHYHMFGLKHSLIQLYGTESGYQMHELSDALLNKKMEICDELLDVCLKLDPHTIRLSIYVGIILYEMQTVLLERGNRIIANKTTAEVATEAIEGYKVALGHLLTAANVLKKELDNVAGSKLSDAVLKAISNLEAVIANN